MSRKQAHSQLANDSRFVVTAQTAANKRDAKFPYVSKEAIGNVTVYSLASETAEAYSDGDVENDLLRLYKSSDPAKKIAAILADNPSWALRYHLSPARGNVVAWHTFKPDSSVLEVGAGCGAITEQLVSMAGRVDALEISKRRSLINAHRNRQAKNLNVLVGNLQDFEPKEKYDYVVCIGVLEYAGTFITHADPYDYFVKLLKRQLKPGGTLLLAIENRLGLKYWAGAREDHTGGLFDSIQGYPGLKKVQTFGREELAELLGSNFRHLRFAYPYPDYKMPHALYSDDYLPGVHCDFPLNLAPAPSPDQTRYHLFSEALAMRSLTANHLFATFSNSFVVTASDQSLAPQAPFSIFQSYRLPEFRLKTQLMEQNNTLTATKTATAQSADHLNHMPIIYDKLRTVQLPAHLTIVKPSRINDTSLAFNYVDGRNAERLLLEAILAGDEAAAMRILRRFMEIVHSLPSISADPSSDSGYRNTFGTSYRGVMECTDYGLLDLNLDNIIVDKTGQWHLIDYEWFFDFPIPKDYIIGRFIYWFFMRRYRDVLAKMAKKLELIHAGNLCFVPPYLEEMLAKYLDANELLKIAQTEAHLQATVSGAKPQEIASLDAWVSPWFNIDEAVQHMDQLAAEKLALQADVEERDDQLEAIRQLKSFRFAKFIGQLKINLFR